ncbi:tyrosinase-like protein 1 isoform X2 [Octopus sinensis]|uniref:Tyrosinase-like protein 1 isoform X2 n=1 Tax=Octopus sinensis TaxID=2607531 RepID=A0A7E6EME7_9MOLL|nr:tyrosinase-like protein 1 isoform X2 [Octopus sinensis]
MKQYIILGVYLFSVCCFANVYSDSLFPVPIDDCLTQLDKSGFSTANASTDFLRKCLNPFNNSLTGWDHPWIISLYKGIFKAYKCKNHPTEACKELRTRREYRQLSDKERHLYHSAFLELYKDTSVPPNKFMALVLLHRDEHSQVAHGGPTFIIWHRLYLSMFEEALRQINSNLTIPYWDVTIDERLPDAALSNIWTEDFMGNGFGRIKNGIFKDWSHDRGFVQRYLGNNDDLPTMEMLLSVLHYPFTKLELVHNRSHAFVGGDMQDSSVSPSDPVFWILHSFYDLVWDYFLKEKARPGKDITQMYPSDDIYPLNRSICVIPVTIKQAIELSVLLSKYVYTYSPQPACKLNKQGCTSQYLTCLNEQCVPSSRDCNEGTVTDNYCKHFHCQGNWSVVPLSISISYSNERQRCKVPCNNASPINLYSNGFRQMTIYLNSTVSEVYVEAVVEMLTSFQDIAVMDSCSNECDAYCLVNDKYERCYKLTVSEVYVHNIIPVKHFSDSKDNGRKSKTRNSNARRDLLFKCRGSRSSSNSIVVVVVAAVVAVAARVVV